jgi:uncharacterized hydrophobic protein (TIGR00341 family)
VKQVQIVVPFEKTESVLNFLLDVADVKNVMKFNADNAHVLQFRIPDNAVLETVEKLKSRGIGVEYGYVDILDLTASLPREAEEESNKMLHREASLAVEEIYENVKKQVSLSFDFIAFVVVAAVMAGFGLMQNNMVIIVASMLLSPLMGPMLGVALGHVVGDNSLFIKGTKNELIALAFSFAVGGVMALLMPILDPGLLARVVAGTGEFASNTTILTEITRRGNMFSGLDIGIAIFSGAAVAISVTRGDMSSLVGVAISAALMPPAVNVGMMIILGIAYGAPVAISIGTGSLALLAMNIVLIDVAAIITFKIKKLTPIANKSATWTGVMEFKQTRSASLYHTAPIEPVSKPEATAATFTPAPSEKEDNKETANIASKEPAEPES